MAAIENNRFAHWAQPGHHHIVPRQFFPPRRVERPPPQIHCRSSRQFDALADVRPDTSINLRTCGNCTARKDF